MSHQGGHHVVAQPQVRRDANAARSVTKRPAPSSSASTSAAGHSLLNLKVVADPDAGFDVDSVLVGYIAVHRHQRSWHDDVTGLIERQTRPLPPLVQ